MNLVRDEVFHVLAAEAVKELVEDDYIGLGSGCTINRFIDALAGFKGRIRGAVAGSVQAAERLKLRGIRVEELNNTGDLPVYFDGADEVTEHGSGINGGHGTLARTKVVAAASRRFVCIVDEAALVPVLGGSAVPVEVIPMARSYVARELVKLGGRPAWRMESRTDDGNLLLDVRGLSIVDPVELETAISQIAGVVAVGLFARRRADIILLATQQGVRRLSPRQTLSAA